MQKEWRREVQNFIHNMHQSWISKC